MLGIAKKSNPKRVPRIASLNNSGALKLPVGSPAELQVRSSHRLYKAQNSQSGTPKTSRRHRNCRTSKLAQALVDPKTSIRSLNGQWALPKTAKAIIGLFLELGRAIMTGWLLFYIFVNSYKTCKLGLRTGNSVIFQSFRWPRTGNFVVSMSLYGLRTGNFGASRNFCKLGSGNLDFFRQLVLAPDWRFRVPLTWIPDCVKMAFRKCHFGEGGGVIEVVIVCD